MKPIQLFLHKTASAIIMINYMVWKSASLNWFMIINLVAPTLPPYCKYCLDKQGYELQKDEKRYWFSANTPEWHPSIDEGHWNNTMLHGTVRTIQLLKQFLVSNKHLKNYNRHKKIPQKKMVVDLTDSSLDRSRIVDEVDQSTKTWAILVKFNTY